MGRLSAPTRLDSEFDVELFDCGVASLNDWLRGIASKNEFKNFSRTFVVCDAMRVVAFYVLASGSVERMLLPKNLARNAPRSVPVVVLGRLAVDKNYQKRGIAKGLLKDALLRTLTVSKHIGIKALLVDAISDSARDFYLQYGFVPLPKQPLTVVLPITGITPLLAEAQ